LIRSNPFGTTPLEGSNIRKIGITGTQEELNRINAHKNRAENLVDKKIKLKRIRKINLKPNNN
jgi:hypothetical protein